jgi:hypothetical protein
MYPPIKLFWSVTVYAADTRALILNEQQIADRSSRMDLRKNDDGSVDIYCGPKAPAEPTSIGPGRYRTSSDYRTSKLASNGQESRLEERRALPAYAPPSRSRPAPVRLNIELRPACNGVQGATALLAFKATMGLWNL